MRVTKNVVDQIYNHVYIKLTPRLHGYAEFFHRKNGGIYIAAYNAVAQKGIHIVSSRCKHND